MTGKLGLKERLSDIAETLSGGLKRRVEIAKGLLHRPQALFLDEPSTGLDPGARHDLWRYLRGLKEEEGVTVLVTTHLMEEAERCDRLGILDHGRLVALDTPQALRATLGGEYVTVHCDSPEVLAERIRERFGVTPQKVGGSLRIARARARVRPRPGRGLPERRRHRVAGQTDARGRVHRTDRPSLLGRGGRMTATAAPVADLTTKRAAGPAVEPGFWLPAWSLCVRELVRFVRQRTRIVGAFGQPLIFWVLFGAGLGETFQAPAWAPAGMSYQEYFLPGVAVLILLFTAIFSTISIIEDRREGFLQAVLVSPIPRASLVFGKVCGGTVLAVAQAVIFLLIGPALRFIGLAPHMGLSLSPTDAVAVFGFLTLEAFALTSVGYVMAWPLDSTQGYHALDERDFDADVALIRFVFPGPRFGLALVGDAAQSAHVRSGRPAAVPLRPRVRTGASGAGSHAGVSERDDVRDRDVSFHSDLLRSGGLAHRPPQCAECALDVTENGRTNSRRSDGPAARRDLSRDSVGAHCTELTRFFVGQFSMSNNLTTDSQPQATSAPAGRPFRRSWFVAGSVMWCLVFVAGAALILVRHKRQNVTEDADKPPVLVLSDQAASAQPGGANASSGNVATPVLPPWNPQGIDDFVFTERSGRKITKADLLGHPWLVAFIFTRCAGPCPRVSAQMSELQTLLKGTDVRLVTLTVDPDNDTPAVLSHYATAYGADPNRWLYLTGDKRKTYQLIMNSFLMPVQEYTGKDREPGYEVMHSTNILRVNEKGVVVQKYNALDPVDIARLRHDLKPYLAAKKK